jgi:ribonuclease ZC3H12
MLQRYVESATCGEEDSSYDSDCEDSGRGHDDVSRTTSDTLGAEFAEYVSLHAQPPGYAQRVEFALKLGYTERHVQAALAKLGPSPAQNELLAELIRLGAAPQHLLPETEAGDEEEPEDVPEVTEDSPVCGPVPGQLRHIVIDGSNVAMR